MQELLIIKSKTFENDLYSKKMYYITDENNNILHDIINVDHMDKILINRYFHAVNDGDVIEIQENIIYNMNDKKFINTLTTCFNQILGEAKNIFEDETEAKFKLEFETFFFGDDTYSDLTIKGKIVYLFEADTIINNFDFGTRYITFGNTLYIFAEVPEEVFAEVEEDEEFKNVPEFDYHEALRNHRAIMNSNIIKIYEEIAHGDFLSYYFYKIGTFMYLENSSFYFNVTRVDDEDEDD